MCAGCGYVGAAVCARCAREMGSVVCLDGERCLAGLERVVGATRYEGVAEAFITAMKFHHHVDSVTYFAERIAGAVATQEFDLITFIPSSVEGWRRRGYHPAELIARPLSELLGVTLRALLVRYDRTSQTARHRSERLRGPELGLCGDTGAIDGARVLIVDDVVTTGTTLSGAALLFCRFRARSVSAAAAALTPHR